MAGLACARNSGGTSSSIGQHPPHPWAFRLGPQQSGWTEEVVHPGHSALAYEHGHAGVAYASRLDARLTLWAVFEGAAFEPVGLPKPLAPDDPDLLAVARLFGLSV